MFGLMKILTPNLFLQIDHQDMFQILLIHRSLKLSKVMQVVVTGILITPVVFSIINLFNKAIKIP